MIRSLQLAACAAAILALGACSNMAPKSAATMPAGAMAKMSPTQGNTVAGTISFESMGDHLMVRAQLTGLKPNGEHGFHLHEKGDCSAPDGTSAGDHWNPTAAPHGPQQMPHHSGDMPSLKADANGNVDASFAIMGVSIGGAGGMPDVIGHGVIVHANPDDYKTQPSGNSGARVSCGVVVRPA